MGTCAIDIPPWNREKLLIVHLKALVHPNAEHQVNSHVTMFPGTLLGCKYLGPLDTRFESIFLQHKISDWSEILRR